jgi:ABC-type sugar transport system ATPase subunit
MGRSARWSENSAGKSTLMKILAGVSTQHVRERDLVDGEPRQFARPDATQAGIAVVHQELSLVRELSIAENIFLGREPRRFGVIRSEELYSRATAVLQELHLGMEAHVPVGYLGIGQQHLVEIAKALSRDARILILDEPTAALTESEVEILFAILERLRARNVGVVYISHKLDEVFRLSDRITVLRDGRCVSTDPTPALDKPRVIAKMVGREIGDVFPVVERTPVEVFEARNVTVGHPFTAKPGIVGLATRRKRQDSWRRTGAISRNEEGGSAAPSVDAIAQGITFVTEDASDSIAARSEPHAQHHLARCANRPRTIDDAGERRAGARRTHRRRP